MRPSFPGNSITRIWCRRHAHKSARAKIDAVQLFRWSKLLKPRSSDQCQFNEFETHDKSVMEWLGQPQRWFQSYRGVLARAVTQDAQFGRWGNGFNKYVGGLLVYENWNVLDHLVESRAKRPLTVRSPPPPFSDANFHRIFRLCQVRRFAQVVSLQRPRRLLSMAAWGCSHAIRPELPRILSFKHVNPSWCTRRTRRWQRVRCCVRGESWRGRVAPK